jgi:hypothetical protein
MFSSQGHHAKTKPHDEKRKNHHHKQLLLNTLDPRP